MSDIHFKCLITRLKQEVNIIPYKHVCLLLLVLFDLLSVCVMTNSSVQTNSVCYYFFLTNALNITIRLDFKNVFFFLSAPTWNSVIWTPWNWKDLDCQSRSQRNWSFLLLDQWCEHPSVFTLGLSLMALPCSCCWLCFLVG